MQSSIKLRLDRLPLINSAAYASDPRADYHPVRNNPFHVLLYVTQGIFRVMIEGTDCVVAPGDLLFMPAHVPHYGRTRCSENRKWYYVHFFDSGADDSLPFISDSRNMIRGHEFTVAVYAQSLTLPTQCKDANHRIEDKLCDLIEIIDSRDPLCGARASAKLYSLLLDIAMIRATDTMPGWNDRTIGKVIAYFEKNLYNPITSQQIADHMNMNYNYLCAYFKRHLNITMHAYHTHLRINEAARLLRETRMNVSQVASAIGYADPVHFSHTFKSIKGISPKFYLRDSASASGEHV